MNGLFSNLSWKFAERLSAQIVTFVVSIILARILGPTEYGTISIVMIFITLANVFVTDGVSSALIQKQNVDDLDFSSVLLFNTILSCILYALLFFSAPLISNFFGEGYEILCPVIRVLGLRVILSSINSVQQAYVAKNMIFKKFFLATLLGTIISAFVGLFMAFKGFGIWALVGQYLTNTFIDTIVLAVSLRKWFGLKCSMSRLKILLPFGVRILGTNLLIASYQEIRSIMISKIYSSADLAFYDKAKQFPTLIITNINTSISAVLFPQLSNEQTDLEKIKSTMKNSIRFSSFIITPMMFGLAAIAYPLISVILTNDWIFAAPLMQLLCINYIFWPIHTANIQAIKATGKGKLYLRLEIIKKIIETVVLLSTIFVGVEFMIVGMCVCSLLFVFINAFPNKKNINYSIKEQMLDLLPSFSVSIIMFGIVFLIGYIPCNDILKLFLQIISGSLFYFVTMIVLKNKEMIFIKNFVLNLKKGDKYDCFSKKNKERST